jgi:hypothetical protein
VKVNLPQASMADAFSIKYKFPQQPAQDTGPKSGFVHVFKLP